MRTAEVRIRADLASALGTEPTTAHGPELKAEVNADQLPALTARLRDEFGAVFADLFGVDARGRGGDFELHLLFSLDQRTVMLSGAKHLQGGGEETLRSAVQKLQVSVLRTGFPEPWDTQGDNKKALDRERAWLHLVAPLEGETPHFPSLTPLLPAADWYEREVWDEVGIEPRGHPALTRLRLPSDWPEGVRPLGHTFAWDAEVPRNGHASTSELVEAPPGVVDYPLGPVRSGVVESVHYGLRTVGEELVDLRLQPFYKHRGVEKTAEVLPLIHLPLLAERISGTSAFAHSLALCQAIEVAAGVEAPPRARYLRTILAELERIYNHLGYHADLCQATGLVVGQAQLDILKERVLRLNAAVGGHRYLFGMNVAGGLARDLDLDALESVKRTTGNIRLELKSLEPMLLGSSSHLDRLEGTGILTPPDAKTYGAVGPIGRASGVDRDLRRDHPYAAYAEAGFEVPVYPSGDALARAKVRLAEIHQSLRIVEQLLDRLPGGPVKVAVGDLPAGVSGLGWAESPRGEGVHWIQIGGRGTLSRYRVRPASFANAQVFPLAVPGHNILTDFPIIEQSFGLSFAGCDR